MSRRAILFSLIGLLLVCVALKPIRAQVTAQIAGTIEDPQHAAVIGANVAVSCVMDATNSALSSK
jgi:uncharacterized membrane protein